MKLKRNQSLTRKEASLFLEFISKPSGEISNSGWWRRRSSAATHRWKMHMREKGKRPLSLEAHYFWQRVKGKLPRYYFSLSWHEAEAGKGRGAARCVRQQVRLGLPCQEVGRACGSYLIYGRAWAQHPTLTFSEQQRGGRKQTLKMKTLWLNSHCDLIYSLNQRRWTCAHMCLYVSECTHI